MAPIFSLNHLVQPMRPLLRISERMGSPWLFHDLGLSSIRRAPFLLGSIVPSCTTAFAHDGNLICGISGNRHRVWFHMLVFRCGFTS